MPTNLFVYLNCNSKSLRLFIILLVYPLFFYGQTLTGLWIGSLSNDSTTVRKDQSFEIALTEYKGKVYGYSRSEFIVDDVLFYVVKRVKGIINGNICEVVDDEIIAFNFPKKLDKGIKVTSIFRRNKKDSIWQLDGTWKTNATKKFYSVTGKVGLEEEKDLTASKIFPHLEELKLANDIAFYKERAEGMPIVKLAKPEKRETEYAKIDEGVLQQSGTTMVANKPIIIEANVIEKGEVTSIKKGEENQLQIKTENIPNALTNTKPLVTEVKSPTNIPQKPVEEKRITRTNNEKREPIKEGPQQEKTIAKQANINTNEQQKQSIVKVKTTPLQTQTQKANSSTGIEKTIIKSETVSNKPGETTKKQESEILKSTAPATGVYEEKTFAQVKPIPPVVKKTIEEITGIAAVISGRKSEFSQEVNYKSDSLVLSLYDNGEIDGDTVSVYLNGEIIMAKQGLKASAIKKTIYISPDSEDFSLVLFAENLGKYPPNTGLLVVRDGEDVYNLRFSSDFQKNSGIVFRRKK